MSKLVLNFKCFLLLYFLTGAEFYNLVHIQGIIRLQKHKKDHFELQQSDLIFVLAEKIKIKIQHKLRYSTLCPNDMNQTLVHVFFFFGIGDKLEKLSETKPPLINHQKLTRTCNFPQSY